MSKAQSPLTSRARDARSESERSAVRDDVFTHLLRWTAGNLLLLPVWWMLSTLQYEGNEWLIGAWGFLTGVVWARILALLFLWFKAAPTPHFQVTIISIVIVWPGKLYTSGTGE